MRTFVSFGLLGLATVALVPFGCSSATIRHHPDDRPRLPAATAERLRACVDELGGELGGGYYTFDATVKVDEEGRVVEVEGRGVPHPELAICMRIALRGMTVSEELLGKLRVSASPAPANGQTAAERALVGNAAAFVLVVVALAEIVIDAAPVAVAIAAAVEATGEIAEVARKPKQPPPNLNRCLDAAAAGGVMWENFCNAIRRRDDRARCWEKTLLTEQEKRGYCHRNFGK
ncbi:hypothetical protein [Polyangium spumosum]|uniref:Lipoprotein n=1 Tax=Polyangium spumosum TaxID=889282 RepID=A0A6N7PPK3_9BACT|nr:hypothetical protein [Polyangium spumosum]MRG93879.1 hypothetical protein [Polyangium spumosum]